MTIEQIISKRKELESSLRNALTFHEKSDTIKVLRSEMLDLRNKCPHKEGETVCPYCGAKSLT